MIGILRMWSPAKCFGFIRPLTGEPDVFLPVSELRRAAIHGIEEGQHLTFEIARHNAKPERPMATKVALVEWPGDRVRVQSAP